MQTDAPRRTEQATAVTTQDIRAYARILLRYAPLIIGITLVTTAISAVYSFTAEKVYEAQVMMRIKRDAPNPFTTFEGAMYPNNHDLDYFQTQIRMFYSRTLIKTVLRELKESYDRPFMAGTTKSPDEIANIFLNKITVRAEPRTQLVRVIIEDTDARSAQIYANTLAQAYIKYAVETERKQAQYYMDWLGKRVREQEDEILQRQRQLREYEVSNQFDATEYDMVKSGLRTKQQELTSLLAEYGAQRESGLDNIGQRDYLQRIADMEKDLTARRAQFTALSSNEVGYSMLEQKVQMARKRYEWMLKASDEGSLMANKDALNPQTISIVDDASVPQRPSKPRKTLNLMLGLVFGLVLGACISFFAEYLDDTVKTPNDVEAFLQVPFLGLIPSLTKEAGMTPIESIVESEPKGTIAEAYRAIRTNILFSSDRKISRMVVTSAGPGEGKTTTAVNLAHVMARAGDRTVLIDADMRRPRIHKIFNIESGKKGLSSYLVGDATLEEIICSTPLPTLSLITTGVTPPNPVELLNGARLPELFEQLGQMYDRIIIDTPPIIAVTDPAILSRLADGVIIAVHGGRAHRDVVKRGIDVLRNVGGQVLGVILNNVNIYRASYYDYYYYSYYRYAYGYRYGYYSSNQPDGKRKRQGKASGKPSARKPSEL